MSHVKAAISPERAGLRRQQDDHAVAERVAGAVGKGEQIGYIE
jgi:hypothetical protein